jgi:hypothetical protein
MLEGEFDTHELEELTQVLVRHFSKGQAKKAQFAASDNTNQVP